MIASAAVLVVLITSAFGCRRSPGRSFTEAVNEITGVRVSASGPDQPWQECTDEHAMEVLRAYLANAMPATVEPISTEKAYCICFRFGDTWEKKPHTASDIIKWGDQWYHLPQVPVTLFVGLVDRRIDSWTIDPDDWNLFKQYGWTPFFLINTVSLDLPASFVHRPGDFPSPVYWAFINELTKDIDLDLTPYLSKRVEVRLYKLVEEVPGADLNRPYGRAIVARCDEKVIGAWLDAAHYACSLKGRGINMLAGPDWVDWKSIVIDPSDPLEQRLAALAPEEVLRTYYKAIDAKDYHMARACESRNALMGALMSTWHFELGNLYEDELPDFNYVSVKLLDVKRNTFYEEGGPPGERRYDVTLDEVMRVEAGAGSGIITPTADMHQETPQTGWRIDGVGFGR